MTRRVPVAALLLGAGLLGLLVGLLALHNVIAAEREEGLAAIATRERLAADYATRALGAELERRAAVTHDHIATAMRDPLAVCEGCYRAEAGTQLFPALAANVWTSQPLRRVYDQVTAAGCAAAADGGLAALVERRGRLVAPVEEEIGEMLALLDACHPSSPLLSGVLRDGVEVAGGRRLEGLQPSLLRHAHRLSRADAGFAAERITALSRRAKVPVNDFAERFAALPPSPRALPNKAGDISAATVVPVDNTAIWYLWPVSGGVEGLRVELEGVLHDIAEQMRAGGMLGPSDVIELRAPAQRPTPLADVELALSAQSSVLARAAVERRHLLKLGLLATCGGMAVTIALLGTALGRRRRRLLELKAQFVADVSHELRTPLASMRVLAETLERRTQQVPEVKDYPARLLRDIDGMSFLVDNILSFNRMTRGRWEPRRERIRLSEVLEGACQEAAERAARPVQTTIEVGDIGCDADPELCKLLFRNLAQNAVAYNRRDAVEMRAEASTAADGSVELLFSDNGVGIAAEERERVFEEFYRGPHSALARGSGLGLALCRRIMALHGGTIGVHKSGRSGTTFRLWFPKAPS